MQSGPAPLFVYGTLKRGHRSYHLMKRARFLCSARTVPGYTLVDCGGYPGLVPLPHSESVVHGELHAVDPEQLAELDAYEDLASGEYVRDVIAMSCNDGSRQTAQSYFFHWPWENLPIIGDTWLPVHETF